MYQLNHRICSTRILVNVIMLNRIFTKFLPLGSVSFTTVVKPLENYLFSTYHFKENYTATKEGNLFVLFVLFCFKMIKSVNFCPRYIKYDMIYFSKQYILSDFYLNAPKYIQKKIQQQLIPPFTWSVLSCFKINVLDVPYYHRIVFKSQHHISFGYFFDHIFLTVYFELK